MGGVKELIGHQVVGDARGLALLPLIVSAVVLSATTGEQNIRERERAAMAAYRSREMK